MEKSEHVKKPQFKVVGSGTESKFSVGSYFQKILSNIQSQNTSPAEHEVNHDDLRCIEVFNSLFPDTKEETAKSAAIFISSLHMLRKPISFNVAFIDGKLSIFFMTSKDQIIYVDDAVFSSYTYSETRRLYEVDRDNNLIKDLNPIKNSHFKYIIHLQPVVNNIAYQYLTLEDFEELDPLANLTNAVFNPVGRQNLIQIVFKGVPDISWRTIIEEYEKKKAIDPYNAGFARLILPGAFGYDSMGKANLPPTIQKELANIEAKKNSLAFKVGFTVASDDENVVEDLASVFSVFASMNYFNKIKPKDIYGDEEACKRELLNLDRINEQSIHNAVFMTKEELASVVHLPSSKVRTPTMQTTSVKVLTVPPDNPEGVRICDAYLRGKTFPVKVTDEDLATHYTILGSTGTGKTTFIENIADAFLQKGYGFAVVDPQDARLIKRIVALIENRYPHRKKDIVWFNPFNENKVITLNPLNPWDSFNPQSLSGLLTNAFYRVWRTSWGPRLEWLMHLALLATTSLNRIKRDAEKSGRDVELDSYYTLRDIFYIYLDQSEFEKTKAKLGLFPELEDVAKEFSEAIDFLRQGRQWTDVVSPILNKLGVFDLNRGIKNAINSPTSSIDLREIVRNNKIFLIDLKTKEAKDISRVIGNVLISLIYQALQETVIERKRTGKGLYGLFLDEVHNFAGEAITNMIQEGRQIGISIVGVTQFVDSFLTDSPEETETIKEAFLSVPKNFIQFGTNSVPDEIIEKFGAKFFTPSDFARLPTFLAYAILSIRNKPEGPMVIQVKPLSSPFDKIKPDDIREEDYQVGEYYIDINELENKRLELAKERERKEKEEKIARLSRVIDAFENKRNIASDPNVKNILDAIRANLINGYLFADAHTWYNIVTILEKVDFTESTEVFDEYDQIIAEYIESERAKDADSVVKEMVYKKGSLLDKMKGIKHVKVSENPEKWEDTQDDSARLSIASPLLWRDLKAKLMVATNNGDKSTMDKIKDRLQRAQPILMAEKAFRAAMLGNKYVANAVKEDSNTKGISLDDIV